MPSDEYNAVHVFEWCVCCVYLLISMNGEKTETKMREHLFSLARRECESKFHTKIVINDIDQIQLKHFHALYLVFAYLCIFGLCSIYRIETQKSTETNDWKLTSPKFCRISSTTFRALLSSGAAILTVLHKIHRKKERKKYEEKKRRQTITLIKYSSYAAKLFCWFVFILIFKFTND